MNPFTSLIGGDVFTVILGIGLVVGVLLFAWVDHRRTSKLPPLGTVLVKNRLKSSSGYITRHP